MENINICYRNALEEQKKKLNSKSGNVENRMEQLIFYTMKFRKKVRTYEKEKRLANN